MARWGITDEKTSGRECFKRRKRIFHNSGTSAELLIVYDNLEDPQKRRKYDSTESQNVTMSVAHGSLASKEISRISLYEIFKPRREQ
jgi:hypothetical protein